MIKLTDARIRFRNGYPREYFASEKMAIRPRILVTLGAVGFLAAMAVLSLVTGGGLKVEASEASSSASHPAATIGHEPYPLVGPGEEGMLRFPLEEFGDGIARYYTFMHGDQPIEFFILRSVDGEVRAAFNACDACYRSQRGYRQDGQNMICNNCGQEFPAEKINIVRGGCNPSPLARTVEETELIIRVEDLILGAGYF